jgi:hypothetical protein
MLPIVCCHQCHIFAMGVTAQGKVPLIFLLSLTFISRVYCCAGSNSSMLLDQNRYECVRAHRGLFMPCQEHISLASPYQMPWVKCACLHLLHLSHRADVVASLSFALPLCEPCRYTVPLSFSCEHHLLPPLLNYS